MPDPGYLLIELGYIDEEAAAVALDIDADTLADYRRKRSGPDYAVVARKIFYSKEALAKWLAAGGARADERDEVPSLKRAGGRR